MFYKVDTKRQTRRGLSIQSQLCRHASIWVRNGEETWGSCLNPRWGPLPLKQTQWSPERPLPSPQYPWLLIGILRSSLRPPANVEGNKGFLPQSKKDLESPSSMCLEVRFPYHSSRAIMRSPSPRTWRPDFPGATWEAPCIIVCQNSARPPTASSWAPVNLGAFFQSSEISFTFSIHVLPCCLPLEPSEPQQKMLNNTLALPSRINCSSSLASFLEQRPFSDSTLDWRSEISNDFERK